MSLEKNLCIALLAIEIEIAETTAVVRSLVDACRSGNRSLFEVMVERRLLDAPQQDKLREEIRRRAHACNWNDQVLIQHLFATLDRGKVQTVCRALLEVAAEGKFGSSHRDRYRTISVLGKGGRGKVWKTEDKLMHRMVAVKEILPDIAADPEQVRRFWREARVTGRLQHPNIVAVFDFVPETDGALPWFVMHIVSGKTLADAIEAMHQLPRDSDERLFELRRLLAVLVTVAGAVGYAHSQGVVHRDLKPQNIALGEFGEVILLDWGLAKTLDSPAEEVQGEQSSISEMDESQAVAASRVGSVIGTPAFMSPEQASGDVDGVTHRSDIYGLGAILFAIETGLPPHRRREGETIYDCLARIITGPTPTVRDEVPTASAALNAICAKAMAHDPKDRYATANEFQLDVRRWLADEPVSVFSEPTIQRLARWGSRHRGLVWIASAFLLGLIIVGTTLTSISFAEMRNAIASHVSSFRNVLDNYDSQIQDAANLRADNIRTVSEFPEVGAYLEAVRKGDAGRIDAARDQCIGKVQPYLTTRKLEQSLTIFSWPAAERLVHLSRPTPTGSVTIDIRRRPATEAEKVELQHAMESAKTTRSHAGPLIPATRNGEIAIEELPRLMMWSPVLSPKTQEPIGAIVNNGPFGVDLGKWIDNCFLADHTGRLLHFLPGSSNTLDIKTVEAAEKLTDLFPEAADVFDPKLPETTMVEINNSQPYGQVVFARQIRMPVWDDERFIVHALSTSRQRILEPLEREFITTLMITIIVLSGAVAFSWLAARMLLRSANLSHRGTHL